MFPTIAVMDGEIEVTRLAVRINFAIKERRLVLVPKLIFELY